jgi:hypothetical protein
MAGFDKVGKDTGPGGANALRRTHSFQIWSDYPMLSLTLRICALSICLSCLAVGAPASAQSSRSVMLILDASGSMNARLPDGQTRIAAAKAAVVDLVSDMDPGTRLALTAYGHQSERADKNCKDVALLSGFDSVEANKADIIAKTEAIVARGYTPITYSLTLAAKDISAEEGDRVVVLVSDGQETCAADPCTAAKALTEADAKLVIHTVGFGVGDATRTQLQCIARMGRGTYFDAANADDLTTVLGKAVVTEAEEKVDTVVVVKPDAPSGIIIENTWAGHGHAVTDAETGTEIVSINGANGKEEVPPGIYNVQFANGLWRGVEVKPGEFTTIEVGLLQIVDGSSDLNGYNLLDPETEEIVVERQVVSSIPLMPTDIIVSSGVARWPVMQIRAGETTVLQPGRIKVSGDKAGEYTVTTENGDVVGQVSRLLNLPLPPGRYIADVEGQKLRIELAAGQTREIKVE